MNTPTPSLTSFESSDADFESHVVLYLVSRFSFSTGGGVDVSERQRMCACKAAPQFAVPISKVLDAWEFSAFSSLLQRYSQIELLDIRFNLDQGVSGEGADNIYVPLSPLSLSHEVRRS